MGTVLLTSTSPHHPSVGQVAIPGYMSKPTKHIHHPTIDRNTAALIVSLTLIALFAVLALGGFITAEQTGVILQLLVKCTMVNRRR